VNIKYSSVRKKLKLGISMHLNYCRKVFAAYLRNKGIEPEKIDLLQGRITDTVFLNHYFRSNINEIITKRIRPVLDELMELI
jgi:intergrase/recombinase